MKDHTSFLVKTFLGESLLIIFVDGSAPKLPPNRRAFVAGAHGTNEEFDFQVYTLVGNNTELGLLFDY